MFQLGAVEPLTLCLFILPSGSTSGRSGIRTCSTMPWFLNDGLIPTAKRSDITISTQLLVSASVSGAHSATYGNRTCDIQESKLWCIHLVLALSKWMSYVHICWVFTVHCVSVYLLAVRFHILKENSSMKMNLKRKGIRYNKLPFFFSIERAVRGSGGATKWKLMKHEELTKNVFSRQGSLQIAS